MAVFKPLAQRFYFKKFALEPEHRRVVYFYTTDAGHAFTHEVTFDFPKGVIAEDLRSAAFALGMSELSHYWKAILAPEIVIEAGQLSEAQKAFWENLYLQGLGEFFYINQIDFRNILTIVSAPEAPLIASSSGPKEGTLVPFGGGKDSLVTAELLKAEGKRFSWFELEPLPFGKKLKEVSGVTDAIAVGRNVQKNFGPIMELVQQGAPNGHVPITATYMMSAVFAAKAHGIKDVVLSLERSAEEGNVEYLGKMINHQYSKSFEFEQAASTYIQEYVDADVRLFSLVRPLYEIQIVQEFTKHPEYFPYFVSCNKGLQGGNWCGVCAKCAFMFAALSAFIPKDTVVGIFKKDLFDDTSLIPLYEELLGMHQKKPFDCVGTHAENALALYLSAKRRTENGSVFPPVLKALPVEKGAAYTSLLTERGPHAIPSDYHTP